ncbi:MAG: hypothetical protein H6662_17905 [Ardenticatenaceae bacterium]|nr:hypothetical protein [Ardenticatenaceae bacterium]MCB8991381.1 hypothetical protein [Ardenticatenaceae bacterium]MCB9003811.1 hypothetical protein [Ardenticatenaceae bacterium]
MSKVANWFKFMEGSKKLESWFEVSWDDEFVYRSVSPPGKEPWSDKFRWEELIRVCFEASDYLYSDDIYFFTSKRPESYVVPIDAKGASELWGVVIEKGYFNAELAIEAALAERGIFCWPKEND